MDELLSSSAAYYLRLLGSESVSEDSLEVATVSDLWQTADWHERECYDMFGIV